MRLFALRKISSTLFSQKIKNMKLKKTLIKLSFSCLFFIQVPALIAQLPIINGWTQFSASADSRLIYVSQSEGDDATATFYTSSSPEIGSDAFQPTGQIQAYQTLNAALTQLRSGFPDWLLLKKGDIWESERFGVVFLSGRNENEPMLIGAYGTEMVRPIVRTNGQEAIHFHGAANTNHFAIVGLQLEAGSRQPSDDPNGITLFSSFENFLIEDCVISSFFNNLVSHNLGNEGEYRRDLRVRRSIIVDAYTLNEGHANALFISNVDGILFEENLLDHNGWREDITGADPTPFRHNSYFQVGNQALIFRANIVARAAATGGGHRCGGVIDNNLYLSNPQNIQFGTFENTIPDVANYVVGEVKNNVVLGARVESFDDGRGVSVAKAQNVAIYHNIVAHFFGMSNYPRGIAITDGFSDLDIYENIVYNWGNNQIPSSENQYAASSGLLIFGTALGMTMVQDNQIQHHNEGGRCLVNNSGFSNVNFQNQIYYSEIEANRWFEPGGTYQNWLTNSGETGSQVLVLNYVEPLRLIPHYMTLLGEVGGLAEFLELVRLQSKDNWSEDLMASTINCWVRQGFQRPILFDYNPSVTIDVGETATLQITNLSTDDFSISFDGQPFVQQTYFQVNPTETRTYQIQLIDHHQEWLMCEPLQFEFEVIVENAPLAIEEYIQLAALVHPSNIELKWQGYLDAPFSIQRSTDGKDFQSLIVLPAFTNSYKDMNPCNGWNYYQIVTATEAHKQVLSNSESVFFGIKGIFPNPVADYLYISGFDESIEFFTIIDTYGTTVTQRKLKGHQIDLTALPRGLYYLEIADQVYKFIKG